MSLGVGLDRETDSLAVREIPWKPKEMAGVSNVLAGDLHRWE